MKSNPAKPTTAQRAAAWAGALALRALMATLRMRVHDEGGFLGGKWPGPVIFAFWHNRIIAVTAGFRRIYPAGRAGVLVLTSASKDGMWLGEVAARLGMGSVRGSSSRRGATAMRELIAAVGKGHDIAITPDGPRGPRYELGAGPVYLARAAGIPIVPIHIRFGRCVRLKTWDGFTIPLPFSEVRLTLAEPLRASQADDAAALEREREKLQSVLRAGVA